VAYSRLKTFIIIPNTPTALVSEGGGRGFESRLVRHISLIYRSFLKERFFRSLQLTAALRNQINCFWSGQWVLPEWLVL